MANDVLLPVPTNPPDTGVFYFLSLPVEWRKVLFAALQNLQFPELWESPPADIIDQLNHLMKLIGDEVIVQYPITYQALANTRFVQNGAALQDTVNTALMLNFESHQQPGALVDQCNYYFPLKAGNYTVHVLGTTANDQGAIKYYVDGVAVPGADQDWYSAASTANVVKTRAITVTSDGTHVLWMVVFSKNAASSGYKIRQQMIWIA